MSKSCSILGFFMIILLIPYHSNAQDSGPGGVGDDSSNRYWFNANRIDQADGTAVNTWNNIGGNPDDALAVNAPELNTNQLNGSSVVNFDAANNELLEIPNDPELNTAGPYSERTFSMVIETGADVSTRQMIYEEGGNERGLNFYIFNGRLYYGAWNLQDDDGGGSAAPWGFSSFDTAISANTSYILTYVFNGNNTSTGNVECYLNGDNVGTISNIGLLYTHSGNIGIGRVNDNTYLETGSTSSNHSFDGSVAEFIIYDLVLNDSERISVENYLSSKYDIGLSSNDIYDQDLSTNGDHDYNLVSINKQSASDEHLNTEQGTGLLSLSTSASLSNGDYFSMGSDVQDQTQFGNITCNANGDDVTRLQTIWRVDKVGSFTPDISFDLINSNADVTSTSDIEILIDDNPSFSSPSTFNANTVTTNEATFSGLSIADGDYITFELAVQKTITNTIAGLSLEQELQFSFEANNIDQDDQTDVSLWENQGQSTLDASPQNNAPELEVSALNGQNALNFDGNNSESFEIANNAIINTGGEPYLERTYSLVIETGNDITSRQVIYEEGGTTRGVNIYILNGELYFGSYNNNDDGTASPWSFTSVSTPISANTAYVVTNIFNGNSTTTGTLTTYLNGDLVGTVNNVGYLYDHGANISIGQNGDGSIFESGTNNDDLFYTGKLAEFLFYDVALTADQTDLLNNHLLAKYGITPSANDIYDHDTAATGDFDFNLAGIRQTSTGIIDRTTYSTGILKIENPSALGSGDRLIAASDEQDLTLLETENINCGSGSADDLRLNGTWRADVKGSPGTVDLEFDYKSINVAIENAGQLDLLIDDNPSFSSPTRLSPDDFCSTAIFQAVTLNDGDYFTLERSGIQPVSWNGTSWNNGSGTSNDPTLADQFRKLVIAGSGASLNENAGCSCLIIELGTDLNLNGNNITIKNDANVSGTLVADNSNLTFNGEVNQSINGNGFTAAHLIVDNENQLDLSLNASERINITDLVDVRNATLNTNDNLTLKSTASNTAQIDEVSGSSAITGDVTVERFFPARRAFRLISPSVNTSTSINTNWQEGVNNTGTNFPADNEDPNNPYGVHITGSTTGANGLDATPSGNPSLFTFDNTNVNWQPVTNTTSPNLNAGTPYRLLVRGDRSINVTDNEATPTPATIRTTGTVQSGNFSSGSLIANQPYFIGNPYQASVDLSSLNLGNVQYAFIWDASINTRGAYVTVDIDNNTNAINDPNFTGSGSSDADRYLQPNQAIFFDVPSTPGISNVDFTESAKAVDQPLTTVFSDNITESLISVRLLAENGNETLLTDGFKLRLNDQYSNTKTGNDARKVDNLDESIALVSNNQLLSIEQRKFPADQEELQLYIAGYQNTDYDLEISKSNLPDDMNVYLVDQYNDVEIPIDQNTAKIPFSIDQNIPESAAWNRFTLKFETETLSTDEISERSDIKMYPNPLRSSSIKLRSDQLNGSDVVIRITDLLGKKVVERSFEKATQQIEIDNLDRLKTGLYFVTIKTNDRSVVKKLIVE